MSYRMTTLPNGLRIATETLPGALTVAIAVSVDVGSRDEKKSENGLSHFLEHMAFKGTARRSAREIAEAFDNVGANLNAYTSIEQTVYYARLLPQDLSLAVEVLGDILLHSSFDEEEMARERQVILQEIAMHQDTPDDLVFDLFNETMFFKQSLGRSILGPKEQVAAYGREDLLQYMHTHYHPSSIVISAAGAVVHEAFVAMVEAHFRYGAAKPKLPREAGIYRGGEKRVTRDLEQLHFVLGFEGISYHDPDYYAAQMMSTALGGGMSSRLFQEVREKRGLVYSVYSFISSFDDAGTFGVYAGLGPEQVPELVPVLCDELQRMAEHGISEEELQRALNQHTAGLVMARESVTSVAEWIGRHLLLYGEYQTLDKLTDRYKAVTSDDVQRVLKRILSGGAPTLTVLGPHKKVEPYEKILERLHACRTQAA